MTSPVLIRARGVARSRIGSLIGIVCLPWVIAWVVISDGVLRAFGLPNNIRPDWLRVAVVFVAILPLMASLVSSLWPGRRFTRALAQEGAWARIDDNGIELWLAPGTIHPWKAVAA